MLIDSHCHLNYPELSGDLSSVIARAKSADVALMQTICTKLSEFDEVHKIAIDHEPVHCSVGVHPHHGGEEKLTLQDLLDKAALSKVIGIGETGLDYFYEHSPREAQQESFRVHIEASRRTGLPLIVHSRDADDDTVMILEQEINKGSFPFLIHCFSSTNYLAEKSIAMGGYISLSGILTFKKSTELQEITKTLPLERLLVETDSPYLAPTPHRGKPCEPAYTRHTAEFLAELRGISYEEVARVTTDNFFRLFGKADNID